MYTDLHNIICLADFLTWLTSLNTESCHGAYFVITGDITDCFDDFAVPHTTTTVIFLHVIIILCYVYVFYVIYVGQ